MVRALSTSRYMSPRKIGALVAVQRENLAGIHQLGFLDAKILSELLINILSHTPLHDGVTRQRRSDCRNFSLPFTPDWKYGNFQGVWDTSRTAIICRKYQMLLPLWFSEETGDPQSPIMESLEQIWPWKTLESELRRILLPASEETRFERVFARGIETWENSLYIIFLLFFASIPFIYATSTNYQNSNSARQVRTETYIQYGSYCPNRYSVWQCSGYLSVAYIWSDRLSDWVKQSCWRAGEHSEIRCQSWLNQCQCREPSKFPWLLKIYRVVWRLLRHRKR